MPFHILKLQPLSSGLNKTTNRSPMVIQLLDHKMQAQQI